MSGAGQQEGNEIWSTRGVPAGSVCCRDPNWVLISSALLSSFLWDEGWEEGHQEPFWGVWGALVCRGTRAVPVPKHSFGERRDGVAHRELHCCLLTPTNSKIPPELPASPCSRDTAPRNPHQRPLHPHSGAFSHHCFGSTLDLLRSAAGSTPLHADGARAAVPGTAPPETTQWKGVKRGGRAEHPQLSPMLQGRASPHQGERSALVLGSVLLLNISKTPHFPHSHRTGHSLPHQLILPSHGAHRGRQAPH